jgi:hypothetical protein
MACTMEHQAALLLGGLSRNEPRAIALSQNTGEAPTGARQSWSPLGTVLSFEIAGRTDVNNLVKRRG